MSKIMIAPTIVITYSLPLKLLNTCGIHQDKNEPSFLITLT